MAQCDVEIGLTINTLFAFTNIGVPNPDSVLFIPCTSERLRGDMTWQRSGPKSFVMTWNTIHEKELYRLLSAIFDDDDTVTQTVYLIAPVTSGSYVKSNKRRLFQCTAKRPNLGGENGKPIDLTYDIYESVSLKFIVISEEVVDFSADVTSGVYPLTVQFTDTSVGIITQWTWDFGDGSAVSHEQNPIHIYETADTFTVTLTVTMSGRIEYKTKVDYVTTRAANDLVAEFSADVVYGASPLTVQFTDLSSHDVERPILTWDWNFGDLGTSEEQNPAHEYTADDDYTVSLAVTCLLDSDTETKVDYVTVESPSTDYQENVLALKPANLIAYWPMSENVGSDVITDLVAGYEMELYDVTMYQDGIGDGSKSIKFAGEWSSALYVTPSPGTELDSTLSLNLNTISIWVKAPASTWENDGLYELFSMLSIFKQATFSPIGGEGGISDVNGQFTLSHTTWYRYCAGGINWIFQGAETREFTDVWHNLTYTINSVSNIQRCFIDGVYYDDASALCAWPSAYEYKIKEIVLGRVGKIFGYVGGSAYVSNNKPFMNGQMAHLAIWNTVLSDAEIAGLAVPTGYWY